MAASSTAPRPWPDGPDRRSRVAPRVTAPLSWLVLAAVVVGVAFGAMACAAGLAEGSGHRVHAQGQDTLVAPATGSHDGHATAAFGAAGEARSPGSATAGNDERSGSAGTSIEGHPGMGCVMTVDLDLDETVIPVMAGRSDTERAILLVDYVVDLDPPVPRSS